MITSQGPHYKHRHWIIFTLLCPDNGGKIAIYVPGEQAPTSAHAAPLFVNFGIRAGDMARGGFLHILGDQG